MGSKNAIYLSLGLHKESLSYRRSLQLSIEAIQHFKTWTFQTNFYLCGSFLPSWIRIPNTDPDPLTRLNPDPIRIRIRIWIRNPALVHYLCFRPLVKYLNSWGPRWTRGPSRPCWPPSRPPQTSFFRSAALRLVSRTQRYTEITHDSLLFSVAQGISGLSTERLSRSTVHYI